MLPIVLLIVLLVLVSSTAPVWPYSQDWGYYPSSGLGAVLVVVALLWVTGIL